jgi:CO dehydrogenase/acetyl-CoA synthase gamma subunit (corrinoid Fe-S protein)
MRKNLKIILPLMMMLLFISCTEMGRKVEEKLDDLNKKTESLDSLVNREIDKVLILDSIIIRESEKVKKLDSLIEKSASRLDSIVNEKVNQLKK